MTSGDLLSQIAAPLLADPSFPPGWFAGFLQRQRSTLEMLILQHVMPLLQPSTAADLRTPLPEVFHAMVDAYRKEQKKAPRLQRALPVLLGKKFTTSDFAQVDRYLQDNRDDLAKVEGKPIDRAVLLVARVVGAAPAVTKPRAAAMTQTQTPAGQVAALRLRLGDLDRELQALRGKTTGRAADKRTALQAEQRTVLRDLAEALEGVARAQRKYIDDEALGELASMARSRTPGDEDHYGDGRLVLGPLAPKEGETISLQVYWRNSWKFEYLYGLTRVVRVQGSDQVLEGGEPEESYSALESGASAGARGRTALEALLRLFQAMKRKDDDFGHPIGWDLHGTDAGIELRRGVPLMGSIPSDWRIAENLAAGMVATWEPETFTARFRSLDDPARELRVPQGVFLRLQSIGVCRFWQGQWSAGYLAPEQRELGDPVLEDVTAAELARLTVKGGPLPGRDARLRKLLADHPLRVVMSDRGEFYVVELDSAWDALREAHRGGAAPPPPR